MFHKLFVFVSAGLLVSVAVAQTSQSSPEMMTGKLFVNGRISGTAFLVGERVILTSAHCLYNPSSRGLDRRDYTVGFCPGAYTNARGQWVTPHGSFRGVMPLGFHVSWWTTAKKIGQDVSTDEKKAMIGEDWAVITLDRSPRLGYFDIVSELPGHYIAKTDGIGYPAFAGGQQYRRKVDICFFDTDPNLVTMEDIVGRDFSGMSGGPYFFKAESGRWTAYAIHGWASGLSGAHQYHRRITSQIQERIYKFNNESADLAMR